MTHKIIGADPNYLLSRNMILTCYCFKQRLWNNSVQQQSSKLNVRINYLFQFPIYFSSLHLSKYRIIFSKTRLNPLPSNFLYSIDFKRTPSLKYVGPVKVTVPKQSSISDNCSGPSYKLVFYYLDKENKAYQSYLSSPIIPQV